jgi:predicted HicB family RNase H-like nuclease
MAISDAKKRATKKWNDANMNIKYDHVHLVIMKGKKADLQQHAAKRSESLNAFVNRAIDEAVERDNVKGECRA